MYRGKASTFVLFVVKGCPPSSVGMENFMSPVLILCGLMPAI